jgi:hypothetical protein
MARVNTFQIVEATIADIHAPYKDGALTARDLVQAYLHRIVAYDRKGPTINSVISVNPKALEEADRLDAAFKTSGPVGPLHGIPVLVKDQADVEGMPTTLGSVLFKDFMPRRDCFVAAKMKNAGAIFLGKVTLGESRRGRYPRLPLRLDPQRLRSQADRGRLLGWIRRKRVGQSMHGLDRSGGLLVDSATGDLEWCRRHATHDRPGEPDRCLRRLADHQRLARPDGPNSY